MGRAAAAAATAEVKELLDGDVRCDNMGVCIVHVCALLTLDDILLITRKTSKSRAARAPRNAR